MLSDVTERSSSKQCIAESVKQYVCVRVSQEAKLARDHHTAEDELTVRSECVDVVSDPDTDG